MQTTMVYATTKRRWTDGELMALPNDGRKHELMEGDLIMSPVGAFHGIICVRLVRLLAAHAEKQQAGEVFDSSTGFRLEPRVMLSPDVAFVSRERLARILVSPDAFLQGAPDLVVEVLSPSDRLKLVQAKLDKYFEHDTRLAWIVDPKRREVTVQTPDHITKLSKPAAMLTGGTVLPGFKCRLSRLFQAL